MLKSIKTGLASKKESVSEFSELSGCFAPRDPAWLCSVCAHSHFGLEIRKTERKAITSSVPRHTWD